MSIHLQPTRGAGHRSTRSRRTVPPRARPRLTVVEHDADMLALLRQLLGEDFEIAVPKAPLTVSAIDAERPDVVLIGTVERGGTTAVTPEEIVGLAARHRGLRRVRTVLLSADPTVLGRAAQLAGLSGVTVVAMPFDADTIRSVMRSVARDVAGAA